MTVFHVHFPARTILLAFSEAVLVLAALIATVFVRFGSDAGVILTYKQVVINLLIASLACMACMYYFDLYQSAVLRSVAANLTRLVQVLGGLCLILVVLYSAFPGTRLGYDLFLWVLLAGMTLALWRIAFLRLLRLQRFAERILFVGDSPLRSLLVSEISQRPELGAYVVGIVADNGESASDVPGLCYLGPPGDLPHLIAEHKLNRVIIGTTASVSSDALRYLRERGVMVQPAGAVYESVFDKVAIGTDADLRTTLPASVSVHVLLAKRIVAVALSVAGLLLFAPFLLIIAVAIRLDSRGPIIFRQQRVGRGGNVFWLYKFRSMFDGADKDGLGKPAVAKDPRFTRVGRLLRKTRLDELPQLYNILRGDMCLVGPRPFMVNMENELAGRIPDYDLRWLVRPGITGWAQVRRPYCVSLEDNIEKLSYDLFYVKHVSLGLDFLICCETLKILLLGRGAQ